VKKNGENPKKVLKKGVAFGLNALADGSEFYGSELYHDELYRQETLKRILAKVPENSMIPNLHISKLTRQLKINFKEINVKSLPRGGSNKKELIQGVTWKQRFTHLPSKRFIKFCIKATSEWVRN
jgi:hypothetical protein